MCVCAHVALHPLPPLNCFSGQTGDVLDLAPGSPKMSVGSEFVPGQGFVPRSSAKTFVPASFPPAATVAPPPPAPSAPSAPFAVAAAAEPAPAAAVAATVAPDAPGAPTVEGTRALLNAALFTLKQGAPGRALDLSFKGRRDVLFPRLEAAVQVSRRGARKRKEERDVE